MSYITRADLMAHPAFAGLATDTSGNPCPWENSYECPDCGATWHDEWSCQCDDECPNCGLSDIAPYRSDWIAGADDAVWRIWDDLPDCDKPL